MAMKDRRPSEKPIVEGLRLLRAIVAQRGFAEVARKTGNAEITIRHWIDMRRRPGADARLALDEAYAIPVRAWTLPATVKSNGASVPSMPAKLPKPQKIGPEVSAKDLVREQLEAIRNRITKAETIDKAGPREVAALEGSYTSALRLYSRLGGELEITEAAILRSTSWARLMRIMRDVLGKHPEAVKEFMLALEAIEDGGGA